MVSGRPTGKQAVRNDEGQFWSTAADPVPDRPWHFLENIVIDRVVDDFEADIPAAATAAASYVRDHGDEILEADLDYNDAGRIAEIVDAARRRYIDGEVRGSSARDLFSSDSETVYNTAFLDGAAAAVAELAASTRTELIGDNSDLEPVGRAVAEDFAAAESAISLLRENRELNGYTPKMRPPHEHSAGCSTLPRPGTRSRHQHPSDDLEEDLQPDRVRYRPAQEPDTVVIEAGFGSTTITVTRRELPGENPRYWFQQHDPNDPFRQGPLIGTDPLQFGVIASGDRFSHPDRTDLYADLGRQVRDHLTGMADAVAAQRQTLADREATKIAATQVVPDHGVRRGLERSL